jgi:CubicO group peptidase (beta-lactamase class C family)
MARLFTSLLCAISFGAVAQSPLAADIDQFLRPYMNPAEPGGVVLVAQKGVVVYKKAFGMASMELNVPMNDSMIFYIGSNTKQFTATAILQLAENGKLSLQDTIGKFISPCPWPVSGIRIEQFLSHTSGMGSNNETAAYKAIDRKGMTPASLVNYFINQPIDFPAGTKWSNNNANFYILGYLIEKLSGVSYATYVAEHIFKPAGMTSTYMDKEISIVNNRPNGYLNFRAGVQNTRVTTIESLYSSGGIQSTVEDMLKWNRALNSGKLLKQETLQLLYTPQTLVNGKQTRYGMGFHLLDVKQSRTYRHGGLVEGFTSETLYLPDEDVYVVILLNEETFKIPIIPVARILAGIAIGKPYSYTAQAIDEKKLPRYTGVYERVPGDLINIAVQNGRLTYQRPYGGVYDLQYAGGGDEFFLNKDLVRIEFTSDSANNIKGLLFSQAGDALSTWTKNKRSVLTLTAERLPDSVLQRFTGSYVSADKDTINILRDRSVLYYQSGPDPKHMIAAESDKSFVSLKEDFRLEFLKDPTVKTEERFYILRKKKKYRRL